MRAMPVHYTAKEAILQASAPSVDDAEKAFDKSRQRYRGSRHDIQLCHHRFSQQHTHKAHYLPGIHGASMLSGITSSIFSWLA